MEKTKMLTLAVSNRKGGSGKTTLATNVAAAYGQTQPTLLIDLDPQADASAALGVDDDTGQALADALEGRASLDTAIRRTPWGVDVAAGGEAVSHVVDLVSPEAVRTAIASVRARRYRNVVIDCPPALSQLVLAAWRAAPDAITVLPVDNPSALRAVGRFRHAWDDAGLDPARLRLVLSRFDRRRVLDRRLAEAAREEYPELLMNARVRESVVVPEASAWQKPLIAYAPRHPLSDDIRRVAREAADV
jgi:chromosome partitioning protein